MDAPYHRKKLIAGFFALLVFVVLLGVQVNAQHYLLSALSLSTVEGDDIIAGATLGYEYRDTNSILKIGISGLIQDAAAGIIASTGIHEWVGKKTKIEMGFLIGYIALPQTRGVMAGFDLGLSLTYPRQSVRAGNRRRYGERE